MRVTGGRFRGRLVSGAPKTRPTQDRVREALFSRWQSRVSDATVLELFCGCGLVSIEALSRGARWAFLVDQSAASLAVARSNFDGLDLKQNSTKAELPKEIDRLPDAWPAKFDLIFADPPYGFTSLAALVDAAATRLSIDGEMVIEHGRRDPIDGTDTVELWDQRRYGETVLSFFRVPAVPR